MSITISYNKHNDTHYAYETTYEWDEEKQKKVQRRRCIGHLDKVTGEIVPNVPRGQTRPVLSKTEMDLTALTASMYRIEKILIALAKNFQRMSDDINQIESKARKQWPELNESEGDIS